MTVKQQSITQTKFDEAASRYEFIKTQAAQEPVDLPSLDLNWRHELYSRRSAECSRSNRLLWEPRYVENLIKRMSPCDVHYHVPSMLHPMRKPVAAATLCVLSRAVCTRYRRSAMRLRPTAVCNIKLIRHSSGANGTHSVLRGERGMGTGCIALEHDLF